MTRLLAILFRLLPVSTILRLVADELALRNHMYILLSMSQPDDDGQLRFQHEMAYRDDALMAWLANCVSEDVRQVLREEVCNPCWTDGCDEVRMQ